MAQTKSTQESQQAAAAPRPRVYHPSGKPGRVQQQFAKQVDINNIVAQFHKTGQLPEGKQSPLFGDLTGIDLQNMENRVVAARRAFEKMPSALRDRFSNDAVKMLKFMDDPANREEATKLGLFAPPKPKERPKPPLDPQQVDLVREALKGPPNAPKSPPEGG